MAAQDVFVVVLLPPSIPPGLYQRLLDAHPRARVALTEDPARFAELLPRADGALVMPASAPLLAPALRAGRLAGAGLDATAVEPLPAESPLWDLPNVIITPHVAAGRDRATDQVLRFVAENIRRFAEGEPLLGTVDREARY